MVTAIKPTAFTARCPCAARPTASSRRAQRPRAYGDESQYFDLKDLENTVGAWDLYGVDDAKRYPDIQNEFFERATSGLNNRGAMLRFLAVGGAVALCTWGGLASRQIGLPITKGPQTKGENGKGGKKGRL